MIYPKEKDKPRIDETFLFKSTLADLMQGHPVGAAMKYFTSRYAEWATELSKIAEDVKYGKIVEPMDIATMWTAHNDARGYTLSVILPHVCL